MRVLIVSDTHRYLDNFRKAVKEAGSIDLLIHCGDLEGSEAEINQIVSCPVEMVIGNNDFFSRLPKEKEFLIGKHRVLLTHGHYYNVSMGYETIKKEAVNRGFDMVMFGHTHKPLVDIDKEIVAINPGSLTYPRQEGREPSYIIMEVDEKGKAEFAIKYL